MNGVEERLEHGVPILVALQIQEGRIVRLNDIQRDFGSKTRRRFVDGYFDQMRRATDEWQRLISLKDEGHEYVPFDWEPEGYLDREAIRVEWERRGGFW